MMARMMKVCKSCGTRVSVHRYRCTNKKCRSERFRAETLEETQQREERVEFLNVLRSKREGS